MKKAIRCPKCKRPLFIMCLMSYPAKYECGCNSCGFALRYYDREDNYKQITQKEVDDFYGKYKTECKN